MKKLSVLLATTLLFGFANKPASVSDTEKKYATDLLLQTEAGVFNAISGLSDAQLNFKPAPDKWSVLDCVKHIAVTEGVLWQMTNGAIMAQANPEKRADVKSTDEQVVQKISMPHPMI